MSKIGYWHLQCKYLKGRVFGNMPHHHIKWSPWVDIYVVYTRTGTMIIQHVGGPVTGTYYRSFLRADLRYNL